MPETAEDKARKLQDAFDEFMRRMRELDHERTETMKRVIGEMERDEIRRILDSLKES